MFRRRQTATPEPPGQDAAGAAGLNGSGGQAGRATTAAKGRPTPKRSEAERRRRPYSAPGDRKEAGRQYRARERDARTRRNEALRRGEEWALPARDRGPVKALARDYVDSRRRVSEYYMYGLLLAVFLLFVRSPVVQNVVMILLMAAIALMLVEGILIGYRVRALVERRLPAESTRGIRMYAAMRAVQIRWMRVPKPRIRPGGSY